MSQSATAERNYESRCFPPPPAGRSLGLSAEHKEWMRSDRAVKVVRGSLAGLCGFALESDCDTVTVFCVAINHVTCNRTFVVRREDIEEGFYGHPAYRADEEALVQEQTTAEAGYRYCIDNGPDFCYLP